MDRYLPEELTNRIDALDERLTAGPAVGDEGRLAATLSGMTESELEECTDELVSIALEVIERASEVEPFHTVA